MIRRTSVSKIRGVVRFSTLIVLALVGIAPRSLSGQKSDATADSCLKVLDLGKHPDGSPVLPMVIGRVLDLDGHSPLFGAHLQITGTRFGTFTDRNGEYRLAFDPLTFDRCRKQYVQVVAPGYKDARFTLTFVGDGARSLDIMLRKH